MIVATLGNTIGSLIAYAIGAWGGRPFLERCGKYVLIRPARDRRSPSASSPSTARATAFFSRLLPVVRTFISFPAGVARMPLGRFIVYSTAGAFLWSIALVYAGTVSSGANWVDIRHTLQPFDTLIVVVVVVARRPVRLVASRPPWLATGRLSRLTPRAWHPAGGRGRGR